MNKIHLLILPICLLIISCSDKSEKITSLSQLKDKRICVLTGSAGDIAARKAFPDAKFMDMITASDAVLTVRTRKADAFIHNKNILLNIVDKELDLKLLEQPVSEVSIAAAIKKGNDKLQADINDVLKTLKSDGTLDNMKHKWIDIKYQTVPALPDIHADAQNGILQMGTCARAEPQTFQYNNIITGFDVELALRIGEMLGKKVEITDMTFESLIPALQSGKIDFALSNFNVTEERKKYVIFSDAYLKNDISVLVKK
jgi:polar amino acid transport system substrate-binding protein